MEVVNRFQNPIYVQQNNFLSLSSSCASMIARKLYSQNRFSPIGNNGVALSYHIYQPLRSGRIWHKVNFLGGFNRFQFRVFPSPRLVASPTLKNLVCPKLFFHKS